MRRVFVPLGLVVFLLVPVTRAHAQRGQLIEDLFRTIADAQLEREQRKRLEAERAAQQQPPVTNTTPKEVPLRPGDRGQRRSGQGRLQAGNSDRTLGESINVRSREAADFAQHLVDFNSAITPLVNDMRSGAGTNVAVRGLLPEAYQVAADSRALLRRCDGLSSLQPIRDPYSELDTRWRQLSFQLRSLDGLSDQCTQGIRNCDRLVGNMSRQLSLEPQFDRRELHDVMIVAATYMQALLDDLQVADIPASEAQRLTHDCRLLRQRLLSEAAQVGEISYGEVVTRFTDFVSRWNELSERIYVCNDPHLQLRLDRIREIGDQTYAMLWMPPPYNAASLTSASGRLLNGCDEVLDQLTFRSMVSLTPQEQTRVMEATHRMYRSSRGFQDSASRGGSRGELQERFTAIDKDWAYLRPIYYRIPSLNRATLTSIDHECERIRRALGVTSAPGRLAALERLIEVAAALEGSAEYLDADIRRYERYLEPSSYRRSIADASHEFLRHSRRLHSQLSQHAELRTLQREAGEMLDSWQRLSKEIAQIASHGLSGRRAEAIQRSQREIVPLVADVAAALVER